MLFQTEQTTVAKIRRLTENKKIRLIYVKPEDFNRSLGNLAGIPSEVDPGEEEVLPDTSLMVFCNVSEKHFNKLLFELRTKNIAVDYKAALTETNRYWTVGRLYPELVRERQNYKNNGL